MEKKNNNGILVGILIGIIIMLLVIIGLLATGTINFKTSTTNDSENNNINTKDTSNNAIEEEDTKIVDDEQLDNNNCKYSQSDIEMMVLKYFVKINGAKAANGEDYQAESLLDNNKYNVRIKHLQVDHITTDEYYVVDCNTGIGNLVSDSEKTINFLEYK